MKSKGVHENKNRETRTFNLGGATRKKSSREIFQGGSASPEDDANPVAIRGFANALRTARSTLESGHVATS
jgi:hypothetical protein